MTRTEVIDMLQSLPPHSRRRAPLEKILTGLTTEDLRAELLEAQLAAELDRALSDVPGWQRDRIRETW